MGIFKECKKSPNGRHLWGRHWDKESNVMVIYCTHPGCGKIKSKSIHRK